MQMAKKKSEVEEKEKEVPVLRRYNDPVLPKEGEYPHGDEARSRSHQYCILKYDIPDMGKTKFAFDSKKFCAGVVVGEQSTCVCNEYQLCTYIYLLAATQGKRKHV